jgi:DDE superfamily endonuclease
MPKPISLPRSSSKKTLPEAVASVQAQHPTATLELWSEDEHRIGLKPIVRRVWRKKGQRPIISVQHRYKWTYLYGFVCPQSGHTFWLLLPTVAAYVWSAVLAEFAAALGAGPTKRIILVIDQAGWHVSDDVVLPDGLHVVFLPPYSPELQPAEHLWSLSDEALVNTHFDDLEALMEAQAERCRRLREQPEIIHAYSHFHWWPEITIP